MKENNDNDNHKYRKKMRPISDHMLRYFTKKRVAVYARVSRESDLKHKSIEAQMDNLKDYIARHPDWEFAGYYVDEGITGTKLDRPEFNRMIDDARAGKIDIILTKSVSRFGRNVAAVLRILQELKTMGVTVIFDSENINTDDNNSLIRLQYNSIMAEKEAEQTSKNQKWSYQRRFREGKPFYVRLYGYTVVNNQLQIIPEEAEVVKRIFSMYLSGLGVTTICKSLNEAGYQNFHGELWNGTSIHRILCNEKYVGDALMQKWYTPDFMTKNSILNRGDLPQYYMEDVHEAIIDRDTFEKVQAEIARRQDIFHHVVKQPSRGKTRLMSQLVRCDHCKRSMYYKLNNSSSRRELWVCGKHLQIGAKYCPVKAIREDILIDATRDVLLSENLIKEDTPLTNELLKKHIKVILAKENYELEYHLYNGAVISKSYKCPSRRESWTPEMKEQARQKALEQARLRREKESHE